MSSLSSSISMLHGISSGPCAFFGFIPFSSFVTPKTGLNVYLVS